MSDRHEKWVRVEAGTVIPAGQPYRVEYATLRGFSGVAAEYNAQTTFTVDGDPNDERVFVDSSWRPPLELPTEPTWGIAVFNGPDRVIGQWRSRTAESPVILRKDGQGCFNDYGVPLDFIPLTDEQVARIEAAR